MRKNIFRKGFPLFFLFCLLNYFSFTGQGEARWATPSEAEAEINYLKEEITVKSEGSEQIIESRVKILNEAGRSHFGVFRTSFNKNIQEIEILEATTLHDGKEFKVPEKNIEKKPVASELNGFDQNMQVSVTYPNVLVGSTVHLKYKITTFKQPLPQYFSHTVTFNFNAVLRHFESHITSDLPLHLKVNDPRKVLEIDQHEKDHKHMISIGLKKDAVIFEDLMNEPKNSFIHPQEATAVSISTFDNHEAFAKALDSNFQKVIAEPLPPLLQKIKEKAEKVTDLKEQINIVTSQLAENIRYISDNTTIEGRYSPRSLAVTTQSAVGDCKDYSAATVAILRALGHKAYIAVVHRGIGYLAADYALPSLDFLNHAMVKVIDDHNQPLWIDPTNVVSMAGKIFPDISHRPAYVLDAVNPTWEKIPAVDPESSQTLLESEITIKDNRKDVKGTLTLKGEQALLIAGAELFVSAQSIKEDIIKTISGETTPFHSTVTLPDLKSRIVPEMLTVEYTFGQQNKLMRTNLGTGLEIESYWGDAYIHASDEQVGTLYVGIPGTIKRTKRIKNRKVKGIENLNFKIEFPWLKASRHCHIKGHDTLIQDTVVICKSMITAAEIKSKEFQKMKEMLNKYTQNVAIILSDIHPPSSS